jgi:hypothetical protein
MQLGEYKKPSFPRPAIITGVSFGNTGGSLFMDLTNSYNIRSLTASSGNFTLVQNGIGSPLGAMNTIQRQIIELVLQYFISIR